MSERPGRYQRSFVGMLGAMLVLLLVVAAFVVFRDSLRSTPVNTVEAVDFAPTAEFARAEATFPILAPEELPEGWRVTSVRFDRSGEHAWHLGMLTDEERYVGLEQADLPVEVMVEEHVDEEAEAGAPVSIDGSQWQRFTDESGDLALLRRAGGVTTVVVGRVPEETLRTLISTLR